MIAKLTD